MNRVLVTGASGFIGRHVVKAAARRGYDVSVMVRNSCRYSAPAPARVHQGDVRDRHAVRSAMEGCDSVIHVAGLYSFDPADAPLMYGVNVNGTENVVREALDLGIERIVYTGTVGSTAFSGKRLAKEHDLAGPDAMDGPYKRSKFEAERIVRRLAAQGAPVVTVCPTATIGAEDEKPTPTGRLILDFMRGRIPAYVDTGLNFVHVRDVAEGHLLALERGTPGARYLLGNVDGNLTLQQALLGLAAITGRPPPRFRVPHAIALAAAYTDTFLSEAMPRRTPRIPLEATRMAAKRMWVDPSWSVQALGLPQTPVAEAFRDAVNWFAAHAHIGARSR